MTGRWRALGSTLSRGAALVATLAAPAVAEEPAKWGGWLDVEGKLGTRRNLGEADLFVPLAQDGRTLVFGDARFRLDDQDGREGNLGLGVRRMVDGWNLGGYGYYDRRRSEYGHTFNQATFGVEALGRDFDARANGYLPFGTRIRPVDALTTAELSGAAILVRGGEERALPGFDAEVGWRVPAFAAEGPYDFRLYAGGYRFDDPAADAVAGPRLRAEFTAYEVPQLWEGARLTLGAEWQTDEVRGSQGFLSLRLRIPLQAESQHAAQLTAQERRMTAPTVRDVDVVAQAGAFGTPEAATQSADGRRLVVLDSASTAGAALPGAVAAAGNDSTVVLSGSFTTGGVVTTLQTGQTLMGAGTLTVRTPSGQTASLATPAASLNLTGGSLYMANNSTVAGLAIYNSSGYGVEVPVSADGATIRDNTITVAQAAIRATGPAGWITDLTVIGNTLSGRLGLEVDGVTGVTAAGNTFDVAVLPGRSAIDARNTTFVTAASTGNVLVSGTCNDRGGNTGFVSFVGGATCP